MRGGGAACSEYKSTGAGAAPVGGAGLRGEELSMEDVGPGKTEAEIENSADNYISTFFFNSYNFERL